MVDPLSYLPQAVLVTKHCFPFKKSQLELDIEAILYEWVLMQQNLCRKLTLITLWERSWVHSRHSNSSNICHWVSFFFSLKNPHNIPQEETNTVSSSLRVDDVDNDIDDVDEPVPGANYDRDLGSIVDIIGNPLNNINRQDEDDVTEYEYHCYFLNISSCLQCVEALSKRPWKTVVPF